jgi:hypothetical protein
MSSGSHPSKPVIVAILVLAQGAIAHAQAPPSEPRSAWALGASAGLWGRLAQRPLDEKTANLALDASVERRINGFPDGGGAIRVQLGWGRGRGPGFEYDRAMIGVLHYLWRSRDYSGLEYAVYIAGGGGAHAVTPVTNLTTDLVRAGRPPSQGTQPSGFAAVGADGWVFGKRRAALRGEFQLYSVGRHIYGSMSLGVQLHFP